MNKNAIKKFAIDARNKLIASVTDKAGMLGITPDNCSEAITKGADFEVYKTAAGTEVTLNKKQCEQRRKLVDQIHARGFEAVVEEVAYTWFNRICAIRFMEVNDYMYPVRVRVLSSEKEGKNEPDVVTMAPDIDWNFTDKEREEIIDAKMNNRLDDLFRMLFVKQCNLLHEVLPGLFEETEDYTEMLLNISFTNEDDVIRMLIDDKRGIPEEDFNVSTIGEDGQPTGQVEIIGWLYQYYNTELKDDTFAKLKKNIKITKERIPAATQLFTPDWIVRYMVENSVGRIWIEHLRAVDSSIDEKVIAERFRWKYYLPEAEQEEAVNVKLAEIRTTYKDLKPTDITCIDPCMGSGHILIAMFDVLMDIYESAGYDKREAAFDIVEKNIHGLDIDQRAYQLAYFAVMMKGRGYNRRFLRGRDGKPEPKIYAIVESNEINRNHLKFFGTHLDATERNLAVMQIEGLLDTLIDAKEYGSILNIEVCDWNILHKFVEDLDSTGQISFENLNCEETQKKIRKIVHLAEVMTRRYDVVATNPPYMASNNFNPELSAFIKKNYSISKEDLYACFIKRCSEISSERSFVAMVTMESWMFNTSFEKFRKQYLKTRTIYSLIHMPYLGKGGTSMGISFGTVAFVSRKNVSGKYNGFYDAIRYFETNEEGIPYCFPVKNEKINCISQDKLSIFPGWTISYWANNNILSIIEKDKTISDGYGDARQGLKTSDNERFLRRWYEVEYGKIGFDCRNNKEALLSARKWFPYNKGGKYRKWYGNDEYVIDWSDDGKAIKQAVCVRYPYLKGNYSFVVKNESKYFLEQITWTTLTSGKLSFRYKPFGYLFDGTGSSIFNANSEILIYLLGLLNSTTGEYLIGLLGQTMSYEVGMIGKVPVRYDENSRVIDVIRECIRICKKDWDSHEISWNFKKFPFAVDQNNIAKAIEKILEANKRLHSKLVENEKVINDYYATLYGLNEKELSNARENENVYESIREVCVKDEIKEFVSYAVGCMFGRYSLDEERIVYAGGEWSDSRYKTFVPDGDNCIPITDEEYFSDDIVGRFVEFVKTVYGADTLEENLDFIAKALGNKGDTSREVIRNYFIKDFYTDHLKVYQKRPIYWMFDSGKQNGFKALIYMHRYDADTVGRVRTDYLHKAQRYVETAMQSAQYTIDNSTSASEKSKATKAVTKYTKQLAEMRIYDEAIAHVANQRIEIDLDDGVKVNYAKFQGVEVAQEGKKALKVDLLAKI